MYADDLALVAGSPEELQAMLDIVPNYAQKWRNNLNADKSVVIVLGETSCIRKSALSARKWTLGDEVLKGVDEQHQLCMTGNYGCEIKTQLVTSRPLKLCNLSQ